MSLCVVDGTVRRCCGVLVLCGQRYCIFDLTLPILWNCCEVYVFNVSIVDGADGCLQCLLTLITTPSLMLRLIAELIPAIDRRHIA